MGRTILVIDDDATGSRLIEAIFGAEGFEVLSAHDGPSGLARIAGDRPDLVLLDMRLPGMDGLEVLERAKRDQPVLPIVMLTAEHDVKIAVSAMRLGALDYLTKPVDGDEIVMVVERALRTRALELEVADLRRRMGEDRLTAQMGPSEQVRQLVEHVRLVAASGFTVLILGETGTGKELVAQAIHRESERAAGPLHAIDCGAIPEQLLESELFGHEKGAFTGADQRRKGRFQLADGGTVFLDEVGNLPISLQAKLLRVLESRTIHAVGATRSAAMDVRFVAATNEDLQARASAGLFRADLYFRLAQYTITLPPLRERPTDVGYLARRFLDEAAVELRRPIHQLAPEALDLLEKHPWPGNVRELRNVVRRALLQASDGVIRREGIRGLLQQARADRRHAATTTARTLREIATEAAETAERHAISEALRAARGNKSQAARALSTDYKTLHLKLKHLGMRARDFTP